MFSLDSTTYEQLLVEAVGINTVCSALEIVLKTGTPNVEPTSAHRPLPPSLKRASTTNMRYLKVCREIASTFREGCRGSTSHHGEPNPSLLVRNECLDLATELVVEPYATQHKHEVSLDAVRRVLGLQERRRPSPRHEDWEVALELLVVRQCATKFMFGQWSLDAAHAELDLALVYVRLANHDMGFKHATEGLSILRQVETHSSVREQLRHKFEFALGTCLILKGEFPSATVQAAKAQAHSHIIQSEREQRWSNLLYLQALAGEKGAHTTLLDACDLVLAEEGSSSGDPLWAYIPILHIHVHLLHRTDEELRSPCVAASKKRLIEAVRGASTKAQLQAVDAMIAQDVVHLQERSKTLHQTLIRQAEHIVHLGRLWLERVLGQSIDSSVPLVGVVALVVCRSASLVGRVEDARVFGEVARKALADQLGPSHMLHIQAAIDSTVPPEVFQGVVGIASLRSTVGGLLSGRIGEETVKQLLAALTKQKDPDESGDLEGEGSQVDILEGCLSNIFAQDVAACRELGPIIACSSALQAHYAARRSADEVKMLALWADALADLLGPHHPHTLQKLEEFVEKRQRTPAPRFTPAWGVRTLLSSVSLTCDVADADIYVSFDGDAPVEDAGVNTSVRYDGPIFLDRLGRVTMKAVAVADGRRSAVVEARFSVVKQ